MAPYLLQFEIMRKAKVLGCQCYDLFGVSPQSEPSTSNGWTDISVFKRKFGGRELRLVPTLECIYDPIAYQEWKAKHGGDSHDLPLDRTPLDSSFRATPVLGDGLPASASVTAGVQAGNL